MQTKGKTNAVEGSTFILIVVAWEKLMKFPTKKKKKKV